MLKKNNKKQYVVIGLGRFGQSVSLQLQKDGFDVLVIDKNQEIINKISDNVTHALCLDVMDESALNDVGLENFDTIIISIGNNLEASIFSIIKAKEVGIKNIIAKAFDEKQGKVLEKIGANKIIYPEKEMGKQLAKSLEFDNLLDSINIGSGYSIVEIIPLNEWTGKSILELNLREKYNFNIIAIKTNENVEVNPQAKRKIKRNDILVIVGNDKNIEKFIQNIK